MGTVLEEARTIDREAMARALDAHKNTTAGILLRLAWRQGLTRTELCDLTWDQVDFAENRLTLPDRTIPMEPETADALWAWRTLYGDCGDHVVISEKLKKPMAPESVSRIVRKALDEEGLTELRLVDLRYDYIRSELEAHDWAYALRVLGLSVTTYRNTLTGLTQPDAAEQPARRSRAEEAELIRAIIDANRDAPAGIALCLSFRLGLGNEEIVALEWKDIDFDGGTVHLPDRDAALDGETAALLRSELARRSMEDDPHVILSPRTRKPVTGSRLSTMVRTILIRGGLSDATLGTVKRDDALEREKERILEFVGEHGSISRSQCIALLGSTPNKVYARLNGLTFSGALVRVNTRYYLPGYVVPPEQQSEAIREYLRKNGTAYCQDIAELLHIGKRTTARLLKRMAEDGELILLRREKRYILPEEN